MHLPEVVHSRLPPCEPVVAESASASLEPAAAGALGRVHGPIRLHDGAVEVEVEVVGDMDQPEAGRDE